MTMSLPNEDRFTKVFQLPEGFRPQRDTYSPAIGSDGEMTTVIIQTDGWVIADPSDSPISLDGIAFTVD